MSEQFSEPLNVLADKKPDKLYFGRIEKDHQLLISQKCPSLLEKLEAMRAGDRLLLSEEEKAFFVESIKEGVPLISNLISDLAGKIWGANSVHWKEDGLWCQENLAASFWWTFNKPEDLVDFYLNTSKEEAELRCQNFFGGHKFGPEVRLK